MSEPNDSASKAYYAAGSYQQGSTPAAVASSDQAFAERLQQQEFGNAQVSKSIIVVSALALVFVHRVAAEYVTVASPQT